jgi:alpha-ketoglutarate-dependent 2,4-dichlorophenoxyacetate dioxygenase
VALQFRQLHRTFVGEGTGIDLSKDLVADEVEAIQAALDGFSVLVFHDQAINDEQRLKFSAHFGPLHKSITINRPGLERRLHEDELSDISNIGKEGERLAQSDRRRRQQLANLLWHTDNSFRKPSGRYTLLVARLVPSDGGQTEFVDTRAAYEALSEDMKSNIAGLTVEHSFSNSRLQAGTPEFIEEEEKRFPPTAQPIVLMHPRTHRQALYIGSHASHVVGLPREEGEALLAKLNAFAVEPRFVYSHKWRVGDVVMWDNRCTLHRGLPFNETMDRRDLRRTSIAEVATSQNQDA